MITPTSEKSSYNGLSPAATYVLTYALPLRKLVITGRDADHSVWLDKKEAGAAVAAGRFDLDRRGLSPAELVAAFGNWSPIVRGWAAQELAARPESKAMVADLIKLADSGDPHQIQGACEALGLIKTPEALPVLVKQLAHPDRWVRYKAAEALKKMGGAAKPAIESILKALVATAEPSWPIRWEDPVQIAHGQLAAAVFSDPLREELNKVDPKLRNQAIRAVSTNPDGMARATLEHCFQNQLTGDDVVALAPVILAAVESPSPADTMFNNVIRDELFDYAHLPDVRELLWLWLKTTVNGDFSDGLDQHERGSILFFYEKMERLVEAAHILHVRNKYQQPGDLTNEPQ